MDISNFEFFGGGEIGWMLVEQYFPSIFGIFKMIF